MSDACAVIATGGKQYTVSVGDIITIEKVPGEYRVGDPITFDRVLLSDSGTRAAVGAPYLSGGAVKGVLESAGRAKKVSVVKYKAKSRYFKRRGHRQPYLRVRITALP